MAIISFLRAFQAYVPSLSSRLMRLLYTKAASAEIQGLAAREFGSWHMLAAVVYVNASVNIHDPSAYIVGIWCCLLTFVHFTWERVAQWTVGGRGLLAIEILAFITFCWMMLQRVLYTGSGAHLA
jgi:hypothetical protein